MVEVPAPNSRTTAIFMKARLQAFIYRYFKRKTTSQQRIRISDILAAFPGHSEAAVRKRLKDCADFQRGGDDSGWWTVKPDIQLPDEDELQRMVMPESVCAYESMLVGMHRFVYFFFSFFFLILLFFIFLILLFFFFLLYFFSYSSYLLFFIFLILLFFFFLFCINYFFKNFLFIYSFINLFYQYLLLILFLFNY